MLQRSPKKSRAPANKHRLNDRFIGDLPVKDKPYLVWDTEQKGLAVRVEPTGYRSFKAIYSRHGRPRWFHIADATAITVKQAHQQQMTWHLITTKRRLPGLRWC